MSAYHPGKRFLKNVTVFLVLCYEYDCKAVGRKNFIMTHSLVCRRGHHEAITLISLGDHKAYDSFFTIKA